LDAILLLINKSANASFGHKKACHDAVQPDEHGGRREGHKARFGSLAAEAKDAGANGGPANEGGHAKVSPCAGARAAIFASSIAALRPPF